MNVNVPAAILARVDPRDSADELERTIERYNDAWNAHDVETIVAFHAPGMVFQNHTAGDLVEGDAVGPHIAGIFERNPDLRFTGRRLYAVTGSSSASGRRLRRTATAGASSGTGSTSSPSRTA